MRGAPSVSGASNTLDRIDTLDPIEAAEIDIAGSKDLIASVSDDLSQHQRWIENYRVSERRHARWLQFQELRYQLELKRRALMRALKRFSLSVALLARAIWTFTVKWTTAFIAWLTPRVHALALTLRTWIAAALAWTWATAVVFARASLKAASIALAWFAATSRDFARASLKAASIAFAWITAKSRDAARASLTAASIAVAWIAVQSEAFAHTLERSASRAWLKARILARVSLRAASVGSSRVAVTYRAYALAVQRSATAGLSRAWATTSSLARASLEAGSEGFTFVAAKSRRLFEKRSTSPAHQALVIRQCTALACIEPLRARLPAIRAN
jgi:hypothetical protein